MKEAAEHPPIIHAIVKRLVDQGLTAEQVSAVLSTQNELLNGDEVGTVRRDEETQRVGHRVEVNGVQMWRVSDPNGDQYNDLGASLPWPVIYPPPEG